MQPNPPVVTAPLFFFFSEKSHSSWVGGLTVFQQCVCVLGHTWRTTCSDDVLRSNEKPVRKWGAIASDHSRRMFMPRVDRFRAAVLRVWTWWKYTVVFFLPLCLTCYELWEQLVVAVDDIDRDVSGRLQEQRAALPRDGQCFSFGSWCNCYLTVVFFYFSRTVQMIKKPKGQKVSERKTVFFFFQPSRLKKNSANCRRPDLCSYCSHCQGVKFGCQSTLTCYLLTYNEISFRLSALFRSSHCFWGNISHRAKEQHKRKWRNWVAAPLPEH